MNAECGSLGSEPSDNKYQVIVSMGLSVECQQYLVDKIREYCPTEKQDSVCPKPI